MAKRKSIKKSNILFTPYPNYYTWGGALAGSIGGAIGNLAGGAISGGLESGAGSAISNIGGTIGNVLSTVNPVAGGIVSAGSEIFGGITNRIVGSKLNTEKIAEIEKSNNAMNTIMVDSADADSVMDQWTNQDFGSNFSKADIGKDGLFSSKAASKYRQLKKQQEAARNRALLAYENAIDAVDTQSDLNAIANFTAYGGPIDIGRNMFNRGGIMHQHGGDFSNGLIFIDNGGTHEQNPFEGVQIGVDAQGIPNMVEEGEVVWNDYVFSNRLKPTKEFKDKYKVKGETFADVAKEMQKESEERPNDPISKRGLEDSMMKLQIEQEDIRMKDNRRGSKNLFRDGGPELPSLKGLQQSVDKWMQDHDVKPAPLKTYTTGIEGVTPIHLQIPEPGFNLSDLRYAPAVGSAKGAATSLLSKPDYTPSDTVLDAANQLGNYTPISYNLIGNYLSYNPFDINHYTNKLNALAGATRRAIMNTSNPSRNAALLAADYNAQDKLGDLAIQAEEYNLAQGQAVEQFNRGTNQANAEMGLKAAMANQETALKARSSRLSGIAQAMQMRDAIDNRRSASISSNLTNLFNNLGNIGKEEYMMNMIRKNPSILYDWLGNYKGTTKANGGYLTIKNKNRRK